MLVLAQVSVPLLVRVLVPPLLVLVPPLLVPPLLVPPLLVLVQVSAPLLVPSLLVPTLALLIPARRGLLLHPLPSPLLALEPRPPSPLRRPAATQPCPCDAQPPHPLESTDCVAATSAVPDGVPPPWQTDVLLVESHEQ